MSFGSNSTYTENSGISSTALYSTYFATANPTVNNTNFPVGKRWINTSTNDEFYLVNYTNTSGILQANWQVLVGSTTVTTIGTYDSQTPNSNGAVIVGNSIYFQSASATVPGMVSTGTQTFSGAKTFNSNITLLGTGNSVGTITSGIWNGTLIGSTYGGTGINNGASTITIGGNVAFSGAFTFTGTLTGATNVTFPTSGTLATTSQLTPLFSSIVVQVLTTSGTYTPTSGMLYCTVECISGGGGGGGCASNDGSHCSVGGGGGGGGYSRITLSAATVGASQAFLIGAAGTAGVAGNNAGGVGGTTSFGSILSVTGGGSGDGGVTQPANFPTTGGGGGIGSSGDFNTVGMPGGSGLATLTACISGYGGSSFFGGGARSANITGSGTGNAAGSYGGGGSGAAAIASGTQQTGGAGFQGIIIVTEYI